MKNKLVLMALFSIGSLVAMDGEGKKDAATHVIAPFNIKEDTVEFLDLFRANQEILVRRDGFDVNKMLVRDSIDYDNHETIGSLKLFVLRDLDEQGKMTLRAFAGYSVLADKKSVRGDLLAVKREDRKIKHYGEHLMRYCIDKVRAEGATDIWASTRKTNVQAQMLYKRVAAQYQNDYELVIESAERRFPKNPRAIEEVLVFNLKPKTEQQP